MKPDPRANRGSGVDWKKYRGNKELWKNLKKRKRKIEGKK